MNSRNPSSTPLLVAGLMSAWLAGPVGAAGVIGEPETLVYGRILNVENPNLAQVVHEGELRWTIRRADGTPLELSGEVDTLAGGGMSYLLRVPHQAVMLGLDPSDGVVPLGTRLSVARHETITFNGGPAAILPPASSSFDLDQLLRAGAVRIDLEVNFEGPDSDGDGLPDWWEDQHGLDKQDGSDALADLNGDGQSNLAAYLAGTDPSLDPTAPRLRTSEVIAYARSSSLVPLEVDDSDSHPGQLVFTLGSLPDGGRLMLRNAGPLPGDTARELAAGDRFTRADVMAGRLVFEHEEGAATGSFTVSVADEDPAHEPSQGEVQVRLFDVDPALPTVGADESLRFGVLALASAGGPVVADFGGDDGRHELGAPSAGLSDAALDAHLANFGAERPHALLGGPAADRLSGGAAGDLLFGGGGADTLRGGGAADRFVFTRTSADQNVILDFNPAEGDVLDLDAVLDGSSTLLTHYVRIRRSGADALVEVSARGTGTGFSDLVIRLKGSPLQPSDLAGLHYGGNLETGAIGLPPRLSLAATKPAASENGPTPGAFTITREGSVDDDLQVVLQVSGSATNGSDYQLIPATLVLPAGEASLEVPVKPYVDGLMEFDEVVFVTLGASPGYLLGSSASAQVVIEDLKPQLSLELLEELASVGDGSPGAVLMRRSGLIAPEVFVQFTLGGSAINGVDYNYVSPFVSLSAGQTTKLIQFVPKPAVDLAGAEAKTIDLSIVPDAAYAVARPSARVLLVPRRLNYATWLAENGLSSTTAGDAPLLRYAFAPDGALPGDAATLARLPAAGLDDDHLLLSFRRKPGIADYRYQVEYSTDLVDWSTGPSVVEDITAQVAPDDPGAAVFRARTPRSEADKAAMRVRLVPQP